MLQHVAAQFQAILRQFSALADDRLGGYPRQAKEESA